MSSILRKALCPGALAATIAVITFYPGGAEGGSGATAASPEFKGSVDKIDRDLRKRITGNSWHRGCPVPISELRLLRVRHWNFDRKVSRGYLMVNAASAGRLSLIHI